MTSQQQRDALHRQIWAIANEVRGAVDGWDFKQFVLGALFYRFISENFNTYIEAGDDSIKYARMADSAIPEEVKADAIKTKGYFIYPSQLFANVAATANTNESLNTDLAAIFKAIESSANGYPSEEDIRGLFSDFDTTSNRLGNTVKEKNARLAKVLKGVEGLPLKFEDNQGDLFGDAYEFLISNYAANAGKSGGDGPKFIITTHNPLFFNVLHNALKSALSFRLCRSQDGLFALEPQKTDSPFSYHLHLLETLKLVAAEGAFEKYHYNLLRNVLEKTATFLGYDNWGDLLPKTAEGSNDLYLKRMIDISSHSKHSAHELAELSEDDKRVLGFLLGHTANMAYQFPERYRVIAEEAQNG